MMGSIYKKASHVLACLGDHSDDSPFFFRKFYGLRRRLVPVRSLFRDSSHNGCKGISTIFRLLHKYSTINRFVLALARLAVHPYFTRLWIFRNYKMLKMPPYCAGGICCVKTTRCGYSSRCSGLMSPVTRRLQKRLGV